MRPLFPLLLLALSTGCGEFGLQELGDTDGEGLLTLDPDGELRFGEASPHGPFTDLEVRFVSAGTSPVQVVDAWVESTSDGVFSTPGTLPLPRRIEPGGDMPVLLRFDPTAQGSFHGVLVVELGPSGTLMERTLTGTGCRDDDADGSCG